MKAGDPAFVAYGSQLKACSFFNKTQLKIPIGMQYKGVTQRC